MTPARRCALPALGAGTALSAMLFASRLPATLDFILPRRAGWPLFALGFEALSRPGTRAAFTAAVSLLMLGAFGRFVWLAASAARERKWSVWDLLAVLVLPLTFWSFSIWFDVSQKILFPFGSLNPLEPLANLIVCSSLIFLAMWSALSSFRSLIPWFAANVLAALLLWSPAPSAPPETRRLFVVLTEEEGRPGQTAYDLPIAAERPVATGVRRLTTLRALYETRAKLMDPAGLRSALMLGVKHRDELARALLLAHLAAAPPSPEALGALGALADETAHRIGPMGASRIALAYAHLGDAAQAALWAKRGEAGPRGIPAGLLDLSGGGALRPGRVSGKLSGVMPLKIGLYRKTDPAAPYLLDAAALVSAAEPDAKGRFSFAGLGAGVYYLAFSFEAPRGEIRVVGHRGDLSLDARRTSLDLSPLTISLISR